MNIDLRRFTAALESCRARWTRRTLDYALEIARILSQARKAARTEGRWTAWIEKEARMSRTTVYRYLRIAKFVRENVSVLTHLARLNMVKIHALARLNPADAVRLIKDGASARLSDAQFIRRASRGAPRIYRRAILPNLSAP